MCYEEPKILASYSEEEIFGSEDFLVSAWIDTWWKVCFKKALYPKSLKIV